MSGLLDTLVLAFVSLFCVAVMNAGPTTLPTPPHCELQVDTDATGTLVDWECPRPADCPANKLCTLKEHGDPDLVDDSYFGICSCCDDVGNDCETPPGTDCRTIVEGTQNGAHYVRCSNSNCSTPKACPDANPLPLAPNLVNADPCPCQ